MGDKRLVQAVFADRWNVITEIAQIEKEKENPDLSQEQIKEIDAKIRALTIALFSLFQHSSIFSTSA